MKEKFIPALDFPFLTKWFDLFLTLALPEKRVKGDLIGLMGIKGGEAILDFGCGTGNLLVLGKEKHPEARFEGIDIDPKALAIAKSKIAGRKLDISLTEYDGGALPQAGNTFDKVMTSLAMHHLTTENKLVAMREIFRVLARGGTFYLCDFGRQENPIFILIGDIAAKFEPAVAANFKGLLPALMAEAGFGNVRMLRKYNTRSGTICIYAGDKEGRATGVF